MTDTPPSAKPNPTSVFEGALNRHGHPFQYAVIRRAQELAEAHRSQWIFEVSEFPVEVRGSGTRIDFVLRYFRGGWPGPCLYLVGECKRVNSSLSDWLFARAPYTHRNGPSKDIVVESLVRDGADIFAKSESLLRSDSIYHVAVEVKGVTKGDPGGVGRGAIEEAATQVMKATNGLVECLSRHSWMISDKSVVTLIPTIFTTAKIWTTEVDLGTASLLEGEISLGSAGVIKKPWLWLQYNLSPGLQHSVDRGQSSEEVMRAQDLSRLLRLEFARSIAVVNSEAIDTFLTSPHWLT